MDCDSGTLQFFSNAKSFYHCFVRFINGSFFICSKHNGNNSKSESDGIKQFHWFTVPLILPESETIIENLNEKEKLCEFDRPDDTIDRKLKGIDSDTLFHDSERLSKKPRLDLINDVSHQSEDESENSGVYMSSKNSSCLVRKKCALIIDDTNIIRKVFVRALTNMGFVTKQAENGLKGLLQMKTLMFDLVFCDFLMPVMDGFDCVQQYRAWENENRPCFQQVRNRARLMMTTFT